MNKKLKGLVMLVALLVMLFWIGSFWGISQREIMLYVLGSSATAVAMVVVYKYVLKEVE